MRKSYLLWSLGIALSSIIACGDSGTGGSGGEDGNGANSSGGNNTGGGDGGNGGNPPPTHTLTGILITPLNPLIELDLNTPGTQAFTATGKFLDGVDEDFTDQVTWELSDPTLGTFTGATLDIAPFQTAGAVVTRVTATFGEEVGEAQLTIVAYQQSGPQQDFFFILPYQDPAGNQEKPLDFSTTVPALDTFMLMDTTGSMGEEIGNLQTALTGTVIPGVQALADSQFGAGRFDDFPINPYGSANCDQPFEVLEEITNNVAAVTAAVGSMSTGGFPVGCGNDGPESMIEAWYQASTGIGLVGPAPTNVPPNNSGVGGVGFRQGTMPVILTISDWMSHAPGEVGNCTSFGTSADYAAPVGTVAATRQQAKDSLNNICAKVVGIASDNGLGVNCTAQNDMEDFARATNARVPPSAWDVPARPPGCPAGQCCTSYNGAGRAPDPDGLCPLVFLTNSSGTGLGAFAVKGIEMLTRFATFDVTTEKDGEVTATDGTPLPSPFTTADFIKSITPSGFMLPPAPPVVPDPTFNATAFQGVTPGTTVNFDVVAFNDIIEPVGEALIFEATIRVLADGCTDLDERTVLILVPPADIAPPE